MKVEHRPDSHPSKIHRHDKLIDKICSGSLRRLISSLPERNMVPDQPVLLMRSAHCTDGSLQGLSAGNAIRMVQEFIHRCVTENRQLKNEFPVHQQSIVDIKSHRITPGHLLIKR